MQSCGRFHKNRSGCCDNWPSKDPGRASLTSNFILHLLTLSKVPSTERLPLPYLPKETTTTVYITSQNCPCREEQQIALENILVDNNAFQKTQILLFLPSFKTAPFPAILGPSWSFFKVEAQNEATSPQLFHQNGHVVAYVYPHTYVFWTWSERRGSKEETRR